MRRPLLLLAACAAFLSADVSAAGRWVWNNGKPTYIDFSKQNLERITSRDRGWDVWQKAQDIEYRDSRLPGGKLPVPSKGGFTIPRDTLVKLGKKAVKAGRVTSPAGLAAMAAQEAWELCQEGKWFCKKGEETATLPNWPGVLPYEGAQWTCSNTPVYPQWKLFKQPGGGYWVVTRYSGSGNPVRPDGKGGGIFNGSCPDGKNLHISQVMNATPSINPPGVGDAVTDSELTRGLNDLFDSQNTQAQYDATYGEIEPYLTPDEVTNAHESGQASSAPRDTTTTLPNGDVVKESIRYDVTYKDGDFIINQVTNTTVNGQDQGTTTKPVEPEPTLDYSNSALPEVPDFYEQKYPNGLAGVWSEKSAAFSQTPLLVWLNSFTRGLPSGGECPRWVLPTSGLGNWLPGIGDADVSPPCYVWDFAKWMLMITTLIMCRRIVFGG